MLVLSAGAHGDLSRFVFLRLCYDLLWISCWRVIAARLCLRLSLLSSGHDVKCLAFCSNAASSGKAWLAIIIIKIKEKTAGCHLTSGWNTVTALGFDLRISLMFSLSKTQFQVQVLFVTYTTIQRLYNQQWNESQVRSMDSANIVEYNTREVCIK